jgi:nitrogen fixation-related uncharacterized protein
MFVATWLTFLLSGVGMAVLAATWAVRTRQFEESDRARFLPLGDLAEAELANRPPLRRGASFYANLAVALCGLVVLGLTLAVVLQLG